MAFFYFRSDPDPIFNDMSRIRCWTEKSVILIIIPYTINHYNISKLRLRFFSRSDPDRFFIRSDLDPVFSTA